MFRWFLNCLRKGKTMNVEQAVTRGAEIFEGAELAARGVKENFRGLRDVFMVINGAGKIGSLEMQALSSEADMIATEFEAKVWAMHQKLTKRAQELGIDLPMPRSGTGR